MKKQILIVLLVALMSNVGLTQQYFLKTYGSPQSFVGKSIYPTADGGCLITFSYAGPGYGLMRMDSLGDTLWTRTFGPVGAVPDVIETSNQQILLVQEADEPLPLDEHTTLIMMDANGDTLWTRKYQIGSHLVAVVEADDGGFVVGGKTTYQELFMFKTDATGNMLWSNRYQGTGYPSSGIYQTQERPSIISAIDGGYVMAYYMSNTLNGGYDAAIVKTYSWGGTNWVSFCGGPGPGGDDETFRSIIQLSDGSYIAAGNTDSFGAGQNDFFVVKLASGGNVLWAKTYGTSADENCSNIMELPNGDFYLTGTVSPDHANFEELKGCIAKIDANGNLLESWKQSKLARPYDGILLQDGFLFSGSFKDTAANSSVMMLMKTDWKGYAGCPVDTFPLTTTTPTPATDNTYTVLSGAPEVIGPVPLNQESLPVRLECVDSIFDPTAIPEYETNPVALYPNPATESVTINSNQKLSAIEIYSIHGQLLSTYQNLRRTSGSYTINIQTLPTGIYLVKLVGKREEVTKRLVVVR
jgi:hypothetical protein